MDARFTQIRMDANSHPRSPSFHSCISHNCKIRFFGNALEGSARAKKKGSPSPRLASLSLLTHGHKAGGRIRDYPSQKDPIPEVTLQRVPLCCSSSRNQEQPASPYRTPASCRGSVSSRNGPTPRLTRLAVGAAKSRDPKGGLMRWRRPVSRSSGLVRRGASLLTLAAPAADTIRSSIPSLHTTRGEFHPSLDERHCHNHLCHDREISPFPIV